MEGERIDIYGSHRTKFDREKELLKFQNISERNQQLIKKYISFQMSNNLSPQRCRKISSNIRTVCKIIKKDLDSLDKDDVMDAYVVIKAHPTHAEATKQDFILAIKQFYKWFEDEDERLYDNNPIVRRRVTLMYKFIRQTQLKRYRKKVNAGDILTDEDIKIAIKYCTSIRDRLFIRMLHETGARAGEYLNIRLKHILFDDDGKAKVLVDGKTGPRRIPLIFSVALLRDYIESHPHKDDPNSPLWWTLSQSNHDKPLLHAGATLMVRKVFRRIPDKYPVSKKKCNMHFFRHSRATLLAPTMTESMLCKFMGWTIGSKEVKTYVHLSPEDLDRVYYESLGLEAKKDDKKGKPKCCHFCSAINDVINDYCHRCGRPLDQEVAIKEEIKLDKQKESAFTLFTEMMKNPEFLAFAKQKGIDLSN